MRMALAVIQGVFCLFFWAGHASASGLIDFRNSCFSQGQPQAGIEEKSFASSQLKDPSSLEEILNTLIRVSSLKVSISGNADPSECIGDDCIELSRRRANAISTWLVANGVSKSQIVETSGAGTAQPVYSGTIEEWHWTNRCVFVTPVDGSY